MATLAEQPTLPADMLDAPWVWLNADQRYQDLGLTEFRGDGDGPNGRLFMYEDVPGYAAGSELPCAFLAEDDFGEDADGDTRAHLQDLVFKTRIGVCYANTGTVKTARRDTVLAIALMRIILIGDNARVANVKATPSIDSYSVSGGPILPLLREEENQPWAFTASMLITLRKRVTG